MRFAIDLDHELSALADEVDDIGADGGLSPPVQTRVAPGERQRPEAAFWQGLLAAQLAGEGDGVGHESSSSNRSIGKDKEHPHPASRA
ncbi:hypothetical protein D3C87_1816860 [compost metagenome]